MNVFLFGGILNLEELDWEIGGQLVDGRFGLICKIKFLLFLILSWGC
jgi:hypothetical protein